MAEQALPVPVGLARTLGWVSIGLGLAGAAAPDSAARAVGVPRDRWLLRAVGLRELAAGIGILTSEDPSTWIRARIAGDVMDLGLLAAAGSSSRADRVKVGAAAAVVAGITALDVLCDRSIQTTGDPQRLSGPVHVQKTITINRGAGELYSFWRDFSRLPQVMKNVAAVQVRDDRCSHWVVEGPAGVHLEWDAQITQEQPDRMIAWSSLDGADIENSGCIRFSPAPGNRGTEVALELWYNSPGGAAGRMLAKLFGREPERQAAEDLRRFKQFMETGEIPTTSGQPAGRSEGQTMMDRLAGF